MFQGHSIYYKEMSQGSIPFVISKIEKVPRGTQQKVQHTFTVRKTYVKRMLENVR